MGQEQFTPFKYGVFMGEKKKGETQIIRNPICANNDPLPSTLEEGLDTLYKIFERTVKKYPNKSGLGNRERISKDKYGEYKYKTYKEIETEVIEYATGIALLNLCPEVKCKSGDTFKFLGIYSKNREEWMISDIASHMNSVSIVTLYDTLGDSTIEFILSETNLETIAMESVNLVKIIKLAEEKKISNLKNLILFDDDSKEDIEKGKKYFNIYTFNEVIEKGKTGKVEFTHCKPETLATLSYTSGTTGTPKGTMLTHSQMASQLLGLKNVGFDLTENELYISFLPLAHAFERVINTYCMYLGATVAFYSGSPKRLMEDCQKCKPTVFVCVPRIALRIYDSVMEKVNTSNIISKNLFDIALKEKLVNLYKTGSFTHKLWDKTVFKQIRESIGGRCRLFVIGGAPISSEICEKLKCFLSSPLLLGYGQTETCGASMIQNSLDNHYYGPGGPIPAVEIKLVDISELDYTSDDINPITKLYEPRGEICVRGPAVFKKYLNDEENTKMSFDEDGWLHSGDIGVVDIMRGNEIKIIDRVKSIFKLSQGEYIAPEKIENILCQCKYVSQIYVTGVSTENFVVAVVVPSIKDCLDFLKEKGINCDENNIEQHFKDEILHKEIITDMDKIGRKNGLKGFEVIKKIILFKEGFTIENHLITPTLKLKRHNLKKRFNNEILELYKE